MQTEEIFLAVVERKDPAERTAFLNTACGDDDALRANVEALLKSHEEAGSFLDQDVFEPAPTVNQPLSEKPGDKIGPYKLLQKIGEGGFGIVYMAEQTQPVRRKVALKVIKPGMDTKEVIARFEAERQALALMEHSFIARVYDAGATEGGRPYFVMELVKGVPLTEYCDRNHLPTQQRLKLFVDVCHAVQHAHQKGVIHRDLKPSNIMVTLHDGNPVPKVIDFGVSKALSQQLTEKTLFTAFGQMVGTLTYMSPEQAEMSGLDVDTRCDVYSLGVLLYELLTGRTPFDATRLRKAGYAEMQRIIREEEPLKPSTQLTTMSEESNVVSSNRGTNPKRLGQLVRGDLDWIVMKALEKERDRRYETANGFASDIERFLNEEPVEACPPTVGYRFRKFARRNKGPCTAAAAVALLLLTAAIVSTLAAVKFNQLADDNATLASERVVALDVAEKNLRLATVEQERAERNLDLALQALDAVYLDAIGKEKLLADPILRAPPPNPGPALQTLDVQYVDTIGADADSIAPTEPQELEFISNEHEPLSDLEKELLRRGLDFYDQFAIQNAATPRAALQTAQAHYRVGLLQAALNDHSEAASAYQAAVNRFERLSTEKPLNVSYLRQLAEAYRGLGGSLTDWTAANQSLQNSRRAWLNAIELNPDDPELYRERAAVSHICGDAKARLEDLEIALELDPNDVRILRTCASAYLWSSMHKLRDLDKACQHAERALKLSPTNAHSHLILADVLRYQGKNELALEHHNRAIELAPHSAQVIGARGHYFSEIGQLDRAIEDLDRAIEINPGGAGELCNRGLVHLARGDLEAALLDFRKALQISPHLTSAYKGLADTYLRQRNWQAAFEAGDQVIAINPNYWVHYKHRAIALFHLGRFKDSLNDLKQARELAPVDVSTLVSILPADVAECADEDFKQGLLELATEAVTMGGPSIAIAHCVRGRLQLAMEHEQEADSDFAKAEELAPDDGSIQLRVAIHHSERGRESEALKYHTRTVQLEPANANYWNQRGMCHRRLKLYEQARDDFDRAIELDAGAPAFWTNRALTGFNLRDHEQAISDASRAIEVNPNHPLAHKWRAMAHYALRNWEEAAADYSRVIDLLEQPSRLPGQMTVADWGHLSQALFRLGRYEEARTGLEKTIELRGDDGPNFNRGPRWWFYTMTLWHVGETERSRELLDELERLFAELPPDQRARQQQIRASAVELIREESAE